MRVPFTLCAAFAALLAACSGHPPPSAAPTDAGDDPISIPVPDGGVVTWDGWAGEFVTDYCVACHNPTTTACSGSACHPANGPIPDFRLRSMVVAYAPIIRCGVSTQQDPAWKCSADIGPEKFPVSDGAHPLPTDAQRAMFAGWIDAGCP
ncbi:MAG TPA: hypothetical protein VGI39_10595 [Polyangiaceae bacterium]